MPNFNELSNILSQHLTGNKPRIDCLSQIIQGLIQSRSVSLNKIAQHFSDNVKVQSANRRIQNFLCQYTFDYQELGKYIHQLFNLSQQKIILAIDRTNWQWGRKNINIFMASIVHQGIAIPFMWHILDKKGCSSTIERQQLLKDCIDILGEKNIDYLLADREFIGDDWFNYLQGDNNRIPIRYIIRIRSNTQIMLETGESVAVRTQFAHLKPNENLTLKQTLTLENGDVYITGQKLTHRQKSAIQGQEEQADDYLILATNDPKLLDTALDKYRLRWQIETLFACLKSRGFNLEDTHVTQIDKIQKLVAVCAIAFCWAYKLGIFRQGIKSVAVKNHGRLTNSLFRVGFDLLANGFKKCLARVYKNNCKPCDVWDNFSRLVSFLSPKPLPLLFL